MDRVEFIDKELQLYGSRRVETTHTPPIGMEKGWR
jgi:hypothetical protein